jgi:hypothetical protein
MEELRWLMGTPNGLNLRNVCWHGFLRERTDWSYYTAFIFDSLVRIGNILKTHEIHLKIWQRKKKSSLIEVPFLVARESFTENFPSFDDYRRKLLGDKEDYETPIEIPEDLKRAKKYLREQQWFEYYYFLLPFLEHLLRIIYVSVNELPNEFFRAETNIYYSTCDTMLRRDIEFSGMIRSNCLYTILSPGLLVS